jgi:hypothetical protein
MFCCGHGPKKSRPESRDRILMVSFYLRFYKYYPASFLKEVIKEKIESICNDVFHSASNVGRKGMLQIFFAKNIMLTGVRE